MVGGRVPMWFEGRSARSLFIDMGLLWAPSVDWLPMGQREQLDLHCPTG